VARFEALWNRTHELAALCIAAATLLAAPAIAGTEEGGADPGGRLGGHLGVAVPIVTWTDGDRTDVSDETVVAIPMGVTVKRAMGPLAFDMELVPAVSEHNDVSLTIHPGLILPTRLGALGMRAAFDTENDALGFTPLVAVPFSLGELGNFFIELDVPVRFPKGPVDEVVAIATHFGIAF
jgi:hypothetical protein